jgi:glutamyl-Q tRNA(Asp) synthetase
MSIRLEAMVDAWRARLLQRSPAWAVHASAQEAQYVGRFAPSPSGPLHAGSLLAALASWLDARAHGGRWLIRIEDVDTPRTVPGAADDIIATLASFGMESDEPIMVQSARGAAYQAAFERLQAQALIYGCACSRREIADSTLPGSNSAAVYPGTCRSGVRDGRAPRAWRIRVPDKAFAFEDGLMGAQSAQLARDCGDFVLKRADGLWAYQLAVVVDDAAQGVTHVVRGADLLDSTARQIYLHQALAFCVPRYAHVPLVLNDAGEKLSKQTRAQAVQRGDMRALEDAFARLMR